MGKLGSKDSFKAVNICGYTKCVLGLLVSHSSRGNIETRNG